MGGEEERRGGIERFPGELESRDKKESEVGEEREEAEEEGGGGEWGRKCETNRGDRGVKKEARFFFFFFSTLPSDAPLPIIAGGD